MRQGAGAGRIVLRRDPDAFRRRTELPPWLAVKTTRLTQSARGQAAQEKTSATVSRRPVVAIYMRDLARDLTTQYRSEQLPGFALEALQLLLLDRVPVRRRGVDLDPRQQRAGLEVLDAGGLLHDVRTGQVVTALLQHLHQRPRDVVGVDVARIGLVARWIPLVHEGNPFLHARVVLPLWVGGIHQIGRRDDTLRVFKPGRPHRRAD